MSQVVVAEMRFVMPAARELNPYESLAAYFGAELRLLREMHGMTQDELRRRVDWSLATVASIETARRTPPDTFGARCDELFKLPGSLARLAEAVRRAQMWLDDYKRHESRATTIKIWATLLVPGLFQTEPYARAVLWDGRPVGGTDEQLAADLSERMDRQKILARPDPPQVWAVLHEAVLRQPTESVDVTRAQLRRLVDIARQPNVTIQVLPFAAARHIGSDGPYDIFEFNDGSPLAVAKAGRSGGRLIDQPGDVSGAQQAYDRLRTAALSPEASLGMIMGAVNAIWIDRI